MTPRQIAMMKEAQRHDGFVDIRDDPTMQDIDALCTNGYLLLMGHNMWILTSKGMEALRNAREW